MTSAAARVFDARRLVQWGSLWGLAVLTAESLIVTRGPNATPDLSALPWLVFYLAPVWCVTGCVLAALASRAESRYAVPGVVAAWFAGSFALAAAYVALSYGAWLAIATLNESRGLQLLPDADRWLATPLVIDGLFAYHTWTNLFFGGFLCAAITLEQRSERLRTLLYDASLARERTAAMLGRVQVESFRTQVDPGLVSATLGEIRDLYPRDEARAERLLDALVGFLRAAMPGLRQRASTLGTELQLAHSHAALQAMRGVPTACAITGQPTAAAARLAFPPQVILPLLACATGDDRLSLDVAADAAGRVRLVIRGLGTIPDELARDIVLRLRALDAGAALLSIAGAPRSLRIIELSPPA